MTTIHLSKVHPGGAAHHKTEDPCEERQLLASLLALLVLPLFGLLTQRPRATSRRLRNSRCSLQYG